MAGSPLVRVTYPPLVQESSKINEYVFSVNPEPPRSLGGARVLRSRPLFRTARMMRALRLLLVTLPSWPAADHHTMKIRQVVRPELPVPDVKPAVHHAVATPSDCVPRGNVVLSVTNKHHAKLRPLQFALIGHHSCFMQRVVSVCYNNVTDAFGQCVQSAFIIPPSDFRRSNYANLIWAKWRIIADALEVAVAALWLDADVLILRNPFTALDMLEGSKGASSSRLYDIRYQSEPAPTTTQAGSCEKPLPVCPECGSLNGGQLLVRSGALARAMYASRPHNLSNTDKLDQDWADAIIHNDSAWGYLVLPRRAQIGFFTSCVLPDTFAAQCWALPNFKRSTRRRGDGKRHGVDKTATAACARRTHHFNCCPSSKEKASLMRSMIKTWTQMCGNATTVVEDGL